MRCRTEFISIRKGLALACLVVGVAGAPIRAADRLPSGALQRLGGDESTPSLRHVALSPDGRLAALCGEPAAGPFKRTIQLWDLRTGRCLRTLDGNKRPIRAIVFSPDGKRLVSTGLDGPSASGDTCLWDVSTGERLFRIDTGGEAVRFSDDGTLLETTTPYEVRHCNATTGAEVRRFEGLKWGLALAREGRRLLASTHYRDPRLWLLDVSTGRELLTLNAGRARPLAAAVAPDGRTIAIEDGESGIAVWELATGQLVCTLRGHERRVFALTFSPDGRLLASGSLDRTVRLWEVATGREVARGEGHEDLVTALAFSPAGDRLLSGSTDRTAILWNLPETAPSEIPPAPLDDVEFEEFWNDLAASRLRAYVAVGRIQQHHAQLLPRVRQRLEGILLPADSDRITQLIADLDHPSDLVRRRAHEQLRQLHPPDTSTLEEALRQTASNEVRIRLHRILRSGGTLRLLTADARRARRIIHALDSLPVADARPILELLIAHLPNDEIVRDARETLQRANARASAAQ